MQDFFVHFKLRVFVYVTTITFYAELNAYLDVSLSAKLCLNLPGSLIGPSINALATISLTPNVRVSPEGGVYISVLVIAVTFVIKYIIFSLQVERVGISITGSFNYQLQPTGTAELSGTSLSRACADLYHVWPGNYVDLKAWYQLRKIKYCRASRWLGRFVSSYFALGSCCFKSKTGCFLLINYNLLDFLS